MYRLALFVALGAAIGLASDAGAQDAIKPTQASIRVYEQEVGFIAGVEQRLYTTRFDATRTRMIAGEITLVHPAPAKNTPFTATCEMDTPDGKKRPGLWSIGITMFAGRTQSSDANILWGPGKDQSWTPGTYTIRCFGGGLKLGEGKIQMVLNPPDVPGTEIRVARMRFFPADKDVPPQQQRKYAIWHFASPLQSKELRRIGVELEFRHAPLPGAVSVPISCFYFLPNGQPTPPIDFSYDAQPGDTSGFAAMGVGWDQPGNWSAGVYSAVCNINSRPVAFDRFQVF